MNICKALFRTLFCVSIKPVVELQLHLCIVNKDALTIFSRKKCIRGSNDSSVRESKAQ